MPEFELGILGGGTAVHMALPVLNSFDSVAICHNESPTAPEFANFTFIPNPDELFEQGKVAALYIATPVNTHKDFLLKAAVATIPTLVEKPLCLNLAEAHALNEKTPSNIAVAFRKRFSRAAREVRQSSRSHQRDEEEIEYIWLAPHPGQTHWKLRPDIAGGGILMDVGSHILDLFEYCIGKISDISIVEFQLDPTHNSDSLVKINCHFHNGARGRMLIGWAEQESIQKLEYRSRQKTISWWKLDGEAASQLNIISGQRSDCYHCDRSEEYSGMFGEFRAHCNGTRHTLPSLSDGIRNMELIASIYKHSADFRTARNDD